MAVKVQEAPFELGAEVSALTDGRTDVGAVASFIGLVRDRVAADAAADVTGLELEHYPGMTERALEQIEAEAAARWPVLGSTVIHRVGRLSLGEPIVLVAVASSHRAAAFEAAEFLMDYLKTRAPFWKRELSASGDSRWVDARESDDAAAARWAAGSR